MYVGFMFDDVPGRFDDQAEQIDHASIEFDHHDDESFFALQSWARAHDIHPASMSWTAYCEWRLDTPFHTSGEL